MPRPLFGGRRPRVSIAERRERRAAIDDPAVVLNAAARFLEARSRSIAEVRRHLDGAGYRTDLVETAVARLVELGMLDDAAFGRAWLESRDRARPRGEAALRRELALKGLDREIVAELLAERREGSERAGPLPDDEPRVDEGAAGRLLARRAAALGRIADPRLRRQRAYALLARNGFDPETCRRVAGRFAADVTDGMDDEGAE